MVFDLKFAANSSLVKRIARMQLLMDEEFADELLSLRRKMFLHKITGQQFWQQYKKLLLKSVGKNKKAIQKLFKKIDKEMLTRLKEAEKQEKEKNEEKPLIDLKLPE